MLVWSAYLLLGRVTHAVVADQDVQTGISEAASRSSRQRENNTAETTCNFIYISVADELRMRLRLWHTAHHPLPRPAARAHAVIARARAPSRAGPPPPPKRAPTQGTFGEAELTPEEMQSLCAQYTKTYDGQIPPMWKAAFDGNLPAMKALHFFYRKGVDGFDAMNREDRSMPTHIACLRGHHAVLEWLAGLHWHDGRLVTNFNLRDDGGHTPLWLCAAWGWEKCVRLLLTLPHVHPLVPDAQGVSPEEAARRVGFHQVRRPASAGPSSSRRWGGRHASPHADRRRHQGPRGGARRGAAGARLLGRARQALLRQGARGRAGRGGVRRRGGHGVSV